MTTTYIDRDRVRVYFTKQGHLVKSKVTGLPPREHVGGVRGVVRVFSAASRKRLLELLASLDLKTPNGQRHVATFLTLTTAEILTPQQSKKYLDVFLKRVRRRFPRASAVWRMEFQSRGAPHFHLIMFGLPYWPKHEVQQAWGEVVGEDRPFTRIESITSWRGVIGYAAKYLGKVDSGGNNADTAGVGSGFNNVAYLTADSGSIGRVWGVFNRKMLPLAELVSFSIVLGDWFWELKKLARLHWDGINVDSLQGYTLFMNDPDEFVVSAQLLAADYP